MRSLKPSAGTGRATTAGQITDRFSGRIKFLLDATFHLSRTKSEGKELLADDRRALCLAAHGV